MPRPEPQIAANDTDSASKPTSRLRNGIVFALAAQTVWGLFPAFLKLLAPIPAIDIVAYRAIWAFVFLLFVTFVGSLIRLKGWPQWSELAQNIRNPKTLQQLTVASVLIAINWLGFVIAISKGRILDVSVGYYICPQVVVLLGVLFQKEQLSKTQWIAFALTSVGVLTMAASASGFPWLGLVVAFSFGFYALTKKRIECSAMTSLTFETGILFLPALAFLLYRGCWYSTGIAPESTFSWISPLGLQLLLVMSGIITVLPLALYVTAVKRLPLSLVGVLQFLGPTMHFGLSVFVFGELFDWPRMVGIVLVWVGVAFFLQNAKRVNLDTSKN